MREPYKNPNTLYKFSVKLTQVHEDPEVWDITCLVCGVENRRPGNLQAAINSADIHSTARHGFGVEEVSDK